MDRYFKAAVRLMVVCLVAIVIGYYALTKGTEFIALAIIMLACWFALEREWR